MGKVILDDELRAKLNGLNEVVPVCEPDGRTVGVFLPKEMYLMYLYFMARKAVAPEKLEAAARESGGRKLSDIRRDRLGGA